MDRGTNSFLACSRAVGSPSISGYHAAVGASVTAGDQRHPFVPLQMTAAATRERPLPMPDLVREAALYRVRCAVGHPPAVVPHVQPGRERIAHREARSPRQALA